MPILGLDIGGANLKAATAAGEACSIPFDLWRTPDELPQRLVDLLARFPPVDALAVTMTGELADCFTTKAEGVRYIVQACEQIATGRPVRIWHTSGQFVTPERAVAEPLGVAAANWHALATWAGRLISHGHALLIDIGSTTTDIIPLVDGRPCPRGLTDVDRLLAGELVYTGVRRTPLCAVAPAIPFRGRLCPIAAEFFATTLDVYLLLDLIPEDPDDCYTANGKPATKVAASDRLSRMLCCDRTEVSPIALLDVARYFAKTQRAQLDHAIDMILNQRLGEIQTVAISGSGSFLAHEPALSQARLQNLVPTQLNQVLGQQIAESACAYAVSVVAGEYIF